MANDSQNNKTANLETDNGRLETPTILKSAKDTQGSQIGAVPDGVRASEKLDEAAKTAEQQAAAAAQEEQDMYTETRFFDPESLSFRPLKYPNIDFINAQYQQ